VAFDGAPYRPAPQQQLYGLVRKEKLAFAQRNDNVLATYFELRAALADIAAEDL
jgi:hypothetical protein